jgi:heavy metal sensor kinase
VKSLRLRIVIGCTFIQALMLVFTAVLVFRMIERELATDLDQLLKDKAAILSKSINRENPSEAWPMPKEFDRERLGFFCQGWGSNRNFLWKTEALPAVIPFSKTAGDMSWFYKDFHFETIRSEALGTVRLVTYPVWQGDEKGEPRLFAWVQCLKPLASQQRQLNGIRGWLVGGGTIALLFGALLVNTFVGRWLGSMSALAQTAQQIGRQARLNQRIPHPEGDPEAAELANAFNQMLERVDQATGNQQRLLADASHELRTPLTILRGEIEVALRRDRSAAEYRDVLISNREEIERLSRLAENLLTLARAESGQALGPTEPMDLGIVAREVSQRFKPLAAQRGVTLELEAPEVKIHGDPQAVERVVFNLVENAIRHSPRDETITITVSADDCEARLEVKDAGSGIPPEHLPRLFERFYRVDAARTRSSGGAGLGLAIVKSLVEAHGGRVAVTSKIGEGSAFTVYLPNSQ